MARPSNKKERQTQIIQGLVKAMAKHGYDGASIADIAKAAQLTPGLIHYHFKNKQQILLAALRNLASTHAESLEQRLGPCADAPYAALAAFIDFHLGLGADANPEALACWILLSGEALRNPKVRAEFEKALAGIKARLCAILQRGVAQEVFVCDSVDEAAGALMALIQGYMSLAATTKALIPHGSAARSAKHMAQGLLRTSLPLKESL